MASGLTNLGAYHMADEVMRVMRIAVREAQARNRQLGVPNVYDINGTTYYELSNGELTRTPPEGFGPKNET